METSKDADFPRQLFSDIIPNLNTVLKHTQKVEGVVTIQAKQTVLQATSDLKGALTQAKEYATILPGGEMNVEEQEELILTLEKLRNHKWQELACFAHQVASDSSPFTKVADIRMEVDSTASTPFGL